MLISVCHAHTCARVCKSVRAELLCCWWLGFRIVSRASVINVPEHEGPKDISQTEGSRESALGRGREEDRWVRKKEEVVWRGGLDKGRGPGFSWVLLCFPLCKPWSPAACQQAK